MVRPNAFAVLNELDFCRLLKRQNGRWAGRTYLLDGYHRAVRFWKTQSCDATFGVYVPWPDW
jgi:hypothetical protein